LNAPFDDRWWQIPVQIGICGLEAQKLRGHCPQNRRLALMELDAYRWDMLRLAKYPDSAQ